MVAFKILLGCTGSVAAIKVPQIVKELQNSPCEIEVKVIPTHNACHFFDPSAVGVPVLKDEDEWKGWQKIGDAVLHIELRRWADLLVIAPLDANTMAKLASGLCDNLLTCVVRAWDMRRPLLYAPAMNTHMWDHPLTARHREALQGLGYRELPAVEKTLACGDTGMGAMAEVKTIVAAILEYAEKELDLTKSDSSSS